MVWIYLLIFVLVVMFALGYLYADKLKLLFIGVAAQKWIPEIGQMKTAGDDTAIYNELRSLPEIESFDPAQGAPGYVGSCISRNFVMMADDSRDSDDYYKLYPMCCQDCRARAHYWMHQHLDNKLTLPYVARYMKRDDKEYVVLVAKMPIGSVRQLQRDEFCKYQADKSLYDMNTSYENIVLYDGQICVKNIDMATYYKNSVVFK